MKPTQIVDLFAGPGGLDVAAELLGISTIGLEWSSAACKTRRAAGLETKEGDVRSRCPEDFPDASILTGGPPCQTFTVAGTGSGRKALDDVLQYLDLMLEAKDVHELKNIQEDLSNKSEERTGLVLEPLRWALHAVMEGNPYNTIVLEQVPAVLPVWQAYRRALESKGYKADCGILRAEQFGVPQTRRRAVLIARLCDDPVSLPLPTHRPYQKGVPQNEGDTSLAPWRSMTDILPHKGEFYVISNYGTGGNPRDRGRRDHREPSATVTGKIFRNRLCRPDGTELGRFSPEEAGILQSFPPKYPWRGQDTGQQIGNAVPPRLGMHILCAALGRSAPSEEELSGLEKDWDRGEPASNL
ncbi:DNA cytosine methyltransferase [Actinocorallia libanotica]|uniref:DNA (cytosine-5-)-methyltransferase n=1 Tax=Actinocorallia libanotica TaxID=46162 RepID=A0ABP4BQY2_9ACTN